MTGRSRLTRMEVLVYGTAIAMAIGLIAIVFAAAVNSPRLDG